MSSRNERASQFVNSETQFKNMSGKVFHNLLEDTLKNNILREIPQLQREVGNRLRAGKLASDLIYTLLFEIPGLDTVVQESALIALYGQSKYAEAVEKIKDRLLENNRWSELKDTHTTQAINQDTTYGYLAKVKIDDHLVESNSIVSIDKTVSKQIATVRLISKTLGIDPQRDEELQTVAKNNDFSDIREWEIKQKRNYKYEDEFTKLTELNQWGEIFYEFELHPDGPQYIASIKIGNTTLSEKDKHRTPERAQARARKKLVHQISGPKIEYSPDINFIQDLRDLCERKHLPHPQMIIEKTGDPQNPRINCILFLLDYRGQQTYVLGTGETESEAQNRAAAKASVIVKKIE